MEKDFPEEQKFSKYRGYNVLSDRYMEHELAKLSKESNDVIRIAREALINTLDIYDLKNGWTYSKNLNGS